MFEVIAMQRYARRGFAGALILWSLGCATGAKDPGATATAAAETAPAAAEAPAAPQAPAAEAAPLKGPVAGPDATIPSSPDALEPPDGKWLVDAEGREYFTQEIPNDETQYRWVDDTRKQARFRYGLILDVLSHDDEKLVVKIYRPLQRTPRAPKGLTPEEKEKIVASYRSEIASADRLTFRSFDEGLPRTGQWRQGFDVADIDGDGQLDLVHGPARKTGSTPAIFLGDGQGRWRRWTEARFPAVPFDYGDAAVADLNGDGKADLALASHLRGVSAMIQEGKGAFRLWSNGIEFSTQGAASFSSREIEPIDWNRDGRQDLLVFGEGPRLAVSRIGGDGDRGARGIVLYLNQGDGSWRKQVLSDNQDDIYGDDVVLADLDGDGRSDVLTGSGILGYRGLVNLGEEDGSLRRVLVESLRPEGTFRGLAVGDFDRDGRADFAVGYIAREADVWRTGVDLMMARPGNVWERKTVWNEESQDAIYGLARGDLDGDGALDLVALTGGGTGWVFLGDGKGGLVREEGTEVGVGEKGCRGYHVELADVDRDGADEILAGFAGEGADLMGAPTCPSQGSLRVWKAVPGKS